MNENRGNTREGIHKGGRVKHASGATGARMSVKHSDRVTVLTRVLSQVQDVWAYRQSHCVGSGVKNTKRVMMVRQEDEDWRTRQESNRAIIVENDVGEEEDTEDVRVLETSLWEISGRSLTWLRKTSKALRVRRRIYMPNWSGWVEVHRQGVRAWLDLILVWESLCLHCSGKVFFFGDNFVFPPLVMVKSKA